MFKNNPLDIRAVGGGLVASLCTMILMLGFQATADQDPSTDTVPRLIPYNGTLEFNGSPVTGTGAEAPWLKFELIDNTPAQGEQPGVVYVQSMQVNVFAGRFTAMLGPSDDNGVNINDVVKGGDNLTLQMTILGDPNNANDDVTLSNPQKLVMSPFAMWATNATNFDVANELSANQISTNQISTHQISTNSLTLADGAISDSNGAVEINDSLDITGNLALSGAISDVADTVTVNDNLSITGNLTLNSTISSTGETVSVNDNLSITGDLALNGAISSTGETVSVNDNLSVGSNTVNAGSFKTNQLELASDRIRSHTSNTIFIDDDVTLGSKQLRAGSIKITGPYLQMPKANFPPDACDDDRLGAMYLDTNTSLGIITKGVPCMCIHDDFNTTAAGGYQWIPVHEQATLAVGCVGLGDLR